MSRNPPPHHDLPVARAVKGAGDRRDAFVANAKPKVAAAKRVAIGTVRVGFTVACFVGVVAAVGSNKSKSSYDYKFDAKYDFLKNMPKFDPHQFDYWKTYKPIDLTKPNVDWEAESQRLRRELELDRILHTPRSVDPFGVAPTTVEPEPESKVPANHTPGLRAAPKP